MLSEAETKFDNLIASLALKMTVMTNNGKLKWDRHKTGTADVIFKSTINLENGDKLNVFVNIYNDSHKKPTSVILEVESEKLDAKQENHVETVKIDKVLQSVQWDIIIEPLLVSIYDSIELRKDDCLFTELLDELRKI